MVASAQARPESAASGAATRKIREVAREVAGRSAGVATDSQKIPVPNRTASDTKCSQRARTRVTKIGSMSVVSLLFGGGPAAGF